MAKCNNEVEVMSLRNSLLTVT